MAKDGPSVCVFSDDRRYRYVLTHGFTPNVPGPVNFIMLNPSTADEQQLDPTLRRCRGFASQWGYGSFTVTNLFAYRATNPMDMKQQADPVGPDNDVHILKTASHASLVVLGWGAHGSFRQRDEQVLKLLKNNLYRHVHVYHLGMTGAGQPRHPLYLPSDAVLVRAF